MNRPYNPNCPYAALMLAVSELSAIANATDEHAEAIQNDDRDQYKDLQAHAFTLRQLAEAIRPAIQTAAENFQEGSAALMAERWSTEYPNNPREAARFRTVARRARLAAKRHQEKQPPVFIRAYVEGGILQGIATDQPERIQVFVWDRDEQDDRPSLWEDSPFEITPEEVERTRHEAAFQAWTVENSDDAPDHDGAEDRIKGVQPLPELDGFKARPATHKENGDPLPAPDYSDKPAPCPSVFQKNADLYSDNVNSIRVIE